MFTFKNYNVKIVGNERGVCMLDIGNILKLRTKLEELLKNYNGEEKIKITYDLNEIREIFFKSCFNHDCFPDYVDHYYEFAFDIELMKKIDFTGISFDNFKAENIDFTDFHGVVLNPETLYKQKIIDCKLNGVKINGSLNNCDCSNTDFTGSIGGIMSKNQYSQLKETNNLTDIQVVDGYGEVSDAIDRAFQMVKK